MIRAVFFDLDGTLFDRDTTVRVFLDDQYSVFADDLADIPRDDFLARVTALDDHGYRSKPEVYAIVCREFALPASMAQRLTSDFWARYHTDCRLFPGVIETLGELRRRGKRLGVVTNGTSAIQNRTIDALAIRELMDAILISEAEGVQKPHPEMFHRAASRVGVAPAECCYVGDHPEVDVAGALAAGLQAVWKRTTYWEAPPHDVPLIESLAEVLSYV
jgi:putative hydrolase of the HAD superfamily